MKRNCFIIVTLILLLCNSRFLAPVYAVVTYYWDNVRYITGANIDYPHPDREYYNIPITSSCSIRGDKLWHIQIDHDTSTWLASGGLPTLCAFIGLVVGSMAGPKGSVVGTAVGLILGAIATKLCVVAQDETYCIWFWISIAFIDWLASNYWWLESLLQNPVTYWIAYAAIESAFLLYGYLRIGNTTIYDAVGAGSPQPPPLGDINGDGKIDLIDLNIVYSYLGSNPGNPACDHNGDGKVNYQDLALEFGYYLGWQTRHYTCVPPAIEQTATAFGQTINQIRQKYP